MKKILVIDDETIVREMLKRVLEMIGCEAIEAKDGQEGIEVFNIHHHNIGLVITDFEMPRKNGLEVAGYIKENYPTIKVLLFTGGGDGLDDILINKFTDSYLKKPLRIEILHQEVQRLLEI